MRTILPAAAVIAAVLTTSPQARQPAPPEALDGVDTVLLLKTGKEAFGKSAFKTVHGPFTYLFASAESKAEFESAPEKYAVQLNGLCARMGGTTDGNPSDYAVVDGKIYIFGSDDCRRRFLEAPEKFIPKPPPAMPSAPEAAAKGRELLDRAAAAHGGAALDAVTAYHEVHTLTSAGRDVQVRTMWRFPDAVRTERTFTAGGAPPQGSSSSPPAGPRRMTVATLLRTDGVWTGMVGETGRLSPDNPAGMPELRHRLGRQLVPLLRSRNAPGTQVAALGPASLDGSQIERVRIRRDGLDVTVHVDPATGRVRSMSFVDRNRNAELGDVRLLLSDYRQVDGILIPFAEQGTHNGTPDAYLSRILDAADVNPRLDPALFDPPPGGGR